MADSAQQLDVRRQGPRCRSASLANVATSRLRSPVGSVPGSGVSDGGVSVPDVRGPSRESLW
ncbi:hypothetical protein CKJ64_09870 [Mycobacterium avium]|nr:hypothetical protein CKJ64_09870 [Mycobacterium avium]